MVIFCSVHRYNCLFHYHGCSTCHRSSCVTPYLFHSYRVDVSGFFLFSFCGVFVLHLIGFFVVFMSDVIIDYILFDTLSSFSSFFIVFDIGVHFGL